MYSLLDDLSIVTTIGKMNFEQLAAKSVAIISHDIVESVKNRETVTSIDIGIGVLKITVQDDLVRYKFIPSNKLDSVVKDTYNRGQSKLVADIDSALGKRITKTYKDLF